MCAPSKEKYASAFSPSKVSCRTLWRCVSSGTSANGCPAPITRSSPTAGASSASASGSPAQAPSARPNARIVGIVTARGIFFMSSFSGSVVTPRGGSFLRLRWAVVSGALLVPSLLVGQQTPAVAPEPGCPAIPRAGAAPLRGIDHVRYLADDALQGREVGTAGERCSAAYLATRFAELGLRPAGTGGGWY